MHNLVVIGANFGDEAKGRVVDYLADKYHAKMVVRFNGGANAGHTVIANGETHKFHLLPSAILHPEVTCVMASGMVIDPEALIDEISILQKLGLSLDNLKISSHAHVVTPLHKAFDEAFERIRKGNHIGTTKRGIGPAYADKANRSGVRMIDLISSDKRKRFLHHYRERLEDFNLYLTNRDPANHMISRLDDIADKLRPFVTNTDLLVWKAVKSINDCVIFEGAQGGLLDIDAGTYPYVTSCHTVAGGACIGTGIGPMDIDEVYGVVKSYITRVGEGPLPTEFSPDDPLTDLIRARGNEFGSTTGRPRRIGWFDCVLTNHSIRQSGISQIVLGHLDVLAGLPEVKICLGYEIGDEVCRVLPDENEMLKKAIPVYSNIKGWDESVREAKSQKDLPDECRSFIDIINGQLYAPITHVSVGPGRENTIEIKH